MAKRIGGGFINLTEDADKKDRASLPYNEKWDQRMDDDVFAADRPEIVLGSKPAERKTAKPSKKASGELDLLRIRKKAAVSSEGKKDLTTGSAESAAENANRDGLDTDLVTKLHAQNEADKAEGNRKKAPTGHRFDTEEDYYGETQYDDVYDDYEEVPLRRPFDPAKKRLVRNISLVAGAVLMIGIIVVLIYTLLRVDSISVKGLKQLEESYAVELSGIQIGEHVFMIDEEAVREGIGREPKLEFESMDYAFPDKIVLNVRENLPAACFKTDDQYAVIDKNGKVLSIIKDDSVYAIVDGLTATAFVPGREIATSDDAKMSVLKNLLSVFDNYGITNEISEINLETSYSITYRLRSGMVVKLGQKEDMDRKVYFAVRINERLIEKNAGLGTIDVSYGDRGIFTPNAASAETKTADNALKYNLSEFDYEDDAANLNDGYIPAENDGEDTSDDDPNDSVGAPEDDGEN